MVDCPASLHTGADLIISLAVRLKASAFKPPKPPSDEPNKHMIFNEGQETLDEQILRERKAALINLFDNLDIKPTKSSSIFKQKNGQLSTDDLALLTQQHHKTNKGKKPKTEIVGDGEEVEIAGDEEDLNENELNLIYKKCVKLRRLMVLADPRQSSTK